MSNAREDIFQSGLDQAIREERYRADQRRKETDGIDIVHLLCSCGERFKKKLLTDLLISSSLSFEKFMFGFFREHPGESQREILIIQQLATSRKDHPSVVLLEYLAKSERVYTVTDIVNNLEYAHLFRVIAGFEHQSIRALKEHFSLHRHSACCKAPFSRSKASQIVPRGLSQSGYSSGCRSNKAYRGIILLTFMNDGRHHAVQVKNILEKPSKESGRSYIVYTLSDFSHYVIENFMKHIIWIMSQVDFVVPILTEEYFQMLEEERDMDRSGLDEKYAPYVAEVLLAEWASSFRNKRLRSLKPQGVKWPSRPIYPPFLTCVDKPSALPSILIKSKE